MSSVTSSHFSNVSILGNVDSPDGEVLREEHPLFAAEGSVAHKKGGAVTRAFLESLPEDWKNAHLVVDSQLVWLQKGRRLPTQWFHHEVFPGNNERAYGAANEEREAEHIACAFGAPSEREFLIGDLSALAASGAGGFHCIEDTGFSARHQLLTDALEKGGLHSVKVGMGEVHRYDWNTFQRTLATQEAGFHFHIRVTRGSRRPVVNGLRNVSCPVFTGPWSEPTLP